MKKEDIELYRKIRTHLGNLHQKWKDDPEQDEHCKSNEGYVGILFRGNNWFESSSLDKYINDTPEISMVEVYSYLFGPSRLHTYSSLQEAWEAVKEWKY